MTGSGKAGLGKNRMKYIVVQKCTGLPHTYGDDIMGEISFFSPNFLFCSSKYSPDLRLLCVFNSILTLESYIWLNMMICHRMTHIYN